jgi:hypothetical protein
MDTTLKILGNLLTLLGIAGLDLNLIILVWVPVALAMRSAPGFSQHKNNGAPSVLNGILLTVTFELRQVVALAMGPVEGGLLAINTTMSPTIICLLVPGVVLLVGRTLGDCLGGQDKAFFTTPTSRATLAPMHTPSQEPEYGVATVQNTISRFVVGFAASVEALNDISRRLSHQLRQ